MKRVILIVLIFINLTWFSSPDLLAITNQNIAIDENEEQMTIEEYLWLLMDHISFLTDLAEKYYYMGKIEESIRLQEEALSVIEENLGTNEYIYYSNLARLADFYSYINDSNKAIQLAEDALELIKIEKGYMNADYAFTLTSLANYYSNLGNNQKAVEIGEEALKLKKTLNLDSDLSFAISLNNLGKYFTELNQYDEAIIYIRESLKLRERLNGKQDPFYASSLNNLGALYCITGKYNEAILTLTESIELKKLFYDTRSFDYLYALINLASLYMQVDEQIEALKIYSYILEDFEPKQLEHFLGYFPILWNLTTIYDEQDVVKLKKISNTISNHILRDVKKQFLLLPISERQFLWNRYKSWSNIRIHKYVYKYHDLKFISLAYEALLLSKGVLLNSEMEFDKFLAETGDVALLEKYNEIKSLRLQLNKLYEKPIAERYVDTDSLERQANELERQLMLESAEFGDYTRNLSITWEDVRDNLKEKDAAIEFVSFPLNNDSTMYMAYVLRPGAEAPELVKLFEEKDLKNLIDEYDKASIYANKSASELIWGKMMPQLDGVENIYFAPDGVLHQIAIEYLPDMDGEGMISNKFNLHRVSSTREIVINKHNSPTKEAVVYGGIKYDTDVTTMETESRKYDRTRTRGFSTYYNLGDSLTLRGSLEYLGGSLTEAENINGMMKENNYNSLFLSGNDATEESFKSLSGKANGIIHISTHGFYWTESEAERKASLNDRLMFMSQLGDNTRRNVEDKALTRTGLFMAGAKNALGGVELPEDVDDGILTAQEIANLDLRGLDLVVLSACQTGMGDISGDGVFGLQRGFKKAGANTILMSLWDVSDEATQILMTEFYRNYLSGKSKQESLRHAQQYLRNYTDGEEDYSDPKYWAAFILLDALN